MTRNKGEKRGRNELSPQKSSSPPLKQQKNEEMEALTMSMKKLIADLNEDREERKKEMQEIKDLLAEKQQAWDVAWKEEKKARERIEERLDRLENAERRRNIILSNYTTNESSSRKLAGEMEEFFKEKTKEIVKIDSVSRFKTYNGDRFIVRLRDLEDKFSLMKKKKDMVVERDGKTIPIYINDDLSREDRIIQKKARDECKLLRENGIVAKMGHRRIYVDGKERRWNAEENEFLEKGQGRRGDPK